MNKNHKAVKILDARLEDLFIVFIPIMERGKKYIEHEVTKSNYPDGISRIITFGHRLNRAVRFDANRYSWSEQYHTKISPARSYLPAQEGRMGDEIADTFVFENAIFITGYQIRNDVSLEFEYRKYWEELVDWALTELIKIYSESPAIKDELKFGAALPENIVADNLGGTLTYKHNEQGQTIITGGTINPGYKSVVGSDGVSIKAERTEMQSPAFSVTEYKAQAEEPPTPEKPTRKKLLDQACIEWANRESHGYLGRYTRDEFLEDFQEKTGELITKDEFRRALEDAQKRGIIVKIRGRLKPKTSP